MKSSIIALLLTLLSLESFAQKNKPAEQPNVLIIIADDQGWGDLGFTGNKTVHTPHLDKLAKSGTILDRFYVSPVCSPTRAEILTGRYHVRTGVSGTSTGRVRLDLDETTIAEAFKANGYQTALFGKWHNGGQAPYHPN
ncbi:MAG: sulfatase-like hydrolase/transferase, partial [Bacteroidota bacterium]